MRICIYCQQSFDPNKYSPRQKVCSKPECQHKRQLESMRDWRGKHPNYFKYDESKGEEWLKAQRERFAQDEDAAREYAGAPPEGVKIADAAAWTAVGRVLMNLDEFVTRE